jgi:hypothetical protein
MTAYVITARETVVRRYTIQAESVEQALRAYSEEGAGECTHEDCIDSVRLGEPIAEEA